VFGSGLIRIILLGVAVWFLYRVIKNWSHNKQQGPLPGRDQPRTPAPPGEVLDIMVQDPNCGTYLPRGQAIRVRMDGQDYYFCSQKCREEFRRKKNKQGAGA
jgi:YHS domain-containing protein